LRCPSWRRTRCSFLEREDFKAHEARVCISQGYVLADQRRPKLFTPEQYFKRQCEMVELFADLPQALENSVEIARRCKPGDPARQEPSAGFPDAARRHDR
jgi:DNA polymerase III alpha subunit